MTSCFEQFFFGCVLASRRAEFSHPTLAELGLELPDRSRNPDLLIRSFLAPLMLNDWDSLGDGRYRRAEVYPLDWDDDGFSLDNCTACAASRFGGPLAILREDRRHAAIHGFDKPDFIFVYTSSGKRMCEVRVDLNSAVCGGRTGSLGHCLLRTVFLKLEHLPLLTYNILRRGYDMRWVLRASATGFACLDTLDRDNASSARWHDVDRRRALDLRA